MKKGLLFFRLLALIGFVPVLYFLVNGLTDNALYYLFILVVVISFFAIQLLQWKLGEKEKVKKTMTAMGFMAFVMAILFYTYFK